MKREKLIQSIKESSIASLTKIKKAMNNLEQEFNVSVVEECKRLMNGRGRDWIHADLQGRSFGDSGLIKPVTIIITVDAAVEFQVWVNWAESPGFSPRELEKYDKWKQYDALEVLINLKPEDFV